MSDAPRCPNATLWKASCKRRSCSVCGPRWARDWQRVLAVNLDAVGGPVATIAITGPGAERLPWDHDYCASRGRSKPGHKHSGTKGCRVQERALREWCDTLSYRWQLLRQAARLATKRELGFAPAWIVARVWEPQKRGVPHLHLVVPYGSPAERRAAEVFRRHLAQRSHEYDFGNVQGKLAPLEGREAARYLANYLAGRTSKKGSIRDNIADPRLPRSLLWLTPKLTRETLVTMRTLRRARHLWACTEGLVKQLPCWRDLDEAVRSVTAFRTVYPQRAGPASNVAAALTFARAIDGSRPMRHALRIVWSAEDREYVPNVELFEELTRLAFAATAGDEERAAAAERAAELARLGAALAAAA